MYDWIYGGCGRSFSTAVAYFVTTREGLTGNIFPHGYMRLITVTTAMNCPPSSVDIILPMAESERRRKE